MDSNVFKNATYVFTGVKSNSECQSRWADIGKGICLVFVGLTNVHTVKVAKTLCTYTTNMEMGKELKLIRCFD